MLSVVLARAKALFVQLHENDIPLCKSIYSISVRRQMPTSWGGHIPTSVPCPLNGRRVACLLFLHGRGEHTEIG